MCVSIYCCDLSLVTTFRSLLSLGARTNKDFQFQRDERSNCDVKCMQ